MHTFGDTAAGVPAFLAKLWRLVDDPETNNLICWSKDGRSFIIQNQAQFARELLPLNYKHNNMASFIRQLNMYGFHKITSIENGGLKFDRDEMEFSHPCFKRNCPYLLEHIKRKIANTKSLDEKASVKPEAVTKVLQDVKAMRGRQDSLDSRFSVMKQENEALWREIASLRQKHAKQQQIVNKLIQFLITIVQPTRNMTSVKRHMQLMINDIPENSPKLRKSSESADSDGGSGPVIHELGEELLDEVNEQVDEELSMHPNSPYVASPLSHMERPHSSTSMTSQNYDYSNQSIEDVLSLAGAYNSLSANEGSRRNGGSRHSSAFQPVPAADGGAAEGRQTTIDGASIIQTVNPDGTEILYHVTEVPDASPQHVASGGGGGGGGHHHHHDDNVLVLTTPLVREEMARSQMLRQRNKQRRQRGNNSSSNNNRSSSITSSSLAAKLEPLSSLLAAASVDADLDGASSRKIPRTQAPKMTTRKREKPQTQSQQQQQQQPEMVIPTLPMSVDATVPLQIKCEKQETNLDPMMFLNEFTDNDVMEPPPHTLISPNYSEDSMQSASAAAAAAAPIPDNSANLLSANGDETNLYNADNFITGEMPSDIFDNSPLLANADDSNMSDSYKMKQQLEQQQQFGKATAANGKFSAFFANNNNSSINNGNGSSAGDANGRKPVMSNNGLPTLSDMDDGTGNMPSTSRAGRSAASNNNNSSSLNNNNSNDNMAVTKYKNPYPEHMRDEVHGHLDSVQDELDTLKDLLRGDNYSLDANTLMSNAAMAASMNKSNHFPILDGDFLTKLFNESDILGSYGLNLPNDAFNDKKASGSEVMAYQPLYDLSDMIDINDDKTELNDADSMGMISNGAPSTSAAAAQAAAAGGAPNSALSTPYHS